MAESPCSAASSCYDAAMLSRADDLASMTVLDEQGEKVPLGTLWREKPAVLVFVRHFG